MQIASTLSSEKLVEKYKMKRPKSASRFLYTHLVEQGLLISKSKWYELEEGINVGAPSYNAAARKQSPSSVCAANTASGWECQPKEDISQDIARCAWPEPFRVGRGERDGGGIDANHKEIAKERKSPIVKARVSERPIERLSDTKIAT